MMSSVQRAAIKPGDYVRSYDFEGREDCYYEGWVETIVDSMAGSPCRGYRIAVARQVWNGKRHEPPDNDIVIAPLNGTPISTGGVCHLVKDASMSRVLQTFRPGQWYTAAMGLSITRLPADRFVWAVTELELDNKLISQERNYGGGCKVTEFRLAYGAVD